MNIYETCPVLSNERFTLRLVTEEDRADLLTVYSDIEAVPLFNSDNCNGDDFHYTTPERMLQGIQMWLWSYHHGWFVRWSILVKDRAVGTIELFKRDAQGGGEEIVLRLDLRSDYETEGDIMSLLALLLPQSFQWFGCGQLITKAVPAAGKRIRILQKLGFVPEEAPLIGHDGPPYGDYFRVTEAECLYRLAMRHIYGDGVPEDNALAVRLLTRAAELGHAEGIYNLGICYHYGYGTEADLEKAYALYLEAANAGHGKGMELVGRFHNRGIFVPKDREKAEFWLRRATESGDPEAAEEAKKELCIM